MTHSKDEKTTVKNDSASNLQTPLGLILKNCHNTITFSRDFKGFADYLHNKPK